MASDAPPRLPLTWQWQPPPDIINEAGTKSVINDHALTLKIADSLKQAGGSDVNFIAASLPAGSTSEDFSVFIEAGVPSVYIGIGGYDPAVIAAYKAKGEPVPTNHSPFFAPDHDRVIPVGIRTLSLAVLTVLH